MKPDPYSPIYIEFTLTINNRWRARAIMQDSKIVRGVRYGRTKTKASKKINRVICRWRKYEVKRLAKWEREGGDSNGIALPSDCH